MAWNKIVGHSKVKEIISKAIINNRVASAYLFIGLDGIGKEAIALEFAKLLNDPNKSNSNGLIHISDGFDARWNSSVLNHNNINIIFPLPRGKSSDPKNDDPEAGLTKAQIEKIQSELEAKSQDYYHKIYLEKANSIRINQIRKIKKDLKYTNSGDGYRVYIISDAHLLNNEAANSFLKTIEEPAEKTVFILTTKNAELIPQTIRSRCQSIKFSPLSSEDLTKFLLSQGLANNQINLAIPFANGSIKKAMDFANQDLQQLRDDVLELLRSSLKRQNYQLDMLSKIDSILQYNDKAYYEKPLMLLSIWLKDAITLSIGSKKIINQDQIESIKKFAEVFKNAKIYLAIIKIENSLLKLRQNVNPQLVFVSLMMHFRKVFLQ